MILQPCLQTAHRTIMQAIPTTALEAPAAAPAPATVQPRWNADVRLVAAVASLAAPGVGQVMLGRAWRGALWLAVCSAAFVALPWTGGAGLVLALATRALPPIDALVMRVARPPRDTVLVASIAALLIATLAIAGLVFTKLMAFVVVHDARMAPAVRDGDVAMIDRFHRAPTVDAVVAYHHRGERGYAVGRVVGCAGDRLGLRGGVLRRNGVEVPWPNAPRATVSMDEVVVPPGHVFILNDDRDDLRDSRTIGPLPLEAIFGTVDYAVLTKRGIYRPVD